MLELVKAHRQDHDLQRQLAETAARELVETDQHSRNRPPLPAAGWSKRQQRAPEPEVKASLAQTIANTRQASAAYRAAMPYTIMPKLTAMRLSSASRHQLLDILNRHTEDHLNLFLTTPTDNADGESPTTVGVGLIHRQRQYLKTVDEDYPPDYPSSKAVSALRQVDANYRPSRPIYGTGEPTALPGTGRTSQRPAGKVTSRNANHHRRPHHRHQR